jgi:hypothetical protein
MIEAHMALQQLCFAAILNLSGRRDEENIT